MAGTLAPIPIHEFGAVAIMEAIKRVNLEGEIIDDVIMGNVLSGGGNIARLTALETGLSINIPGLPVDRQCGSGIKTRLILLLKQLGRELVMFILLVALKVKIPSV